MIVATAGHIDHGKTLLVKTLTGTDTVAPACSTADAVESPPSVA